MSAAFKIRTGSIPVLTTKFNEMEKTIDDFIKELQMISEDKRKLPLVVQCPNGELTSPSIKMIWDDTIKMLEKSPDKMMISWR